MSRYPRPAPWVIGLDLGKINDPSVVLVMRRTSVTAPEFEAMAEDSIVPMEAVPVIDDPGNKTPELLRRESIGARPTPLHPDARKGGPAEAVNGPAMKSEFARGNVEWQRQQEERNA